VLNEVVAAGRRAGLASAGAEARRAALSGGNEVLGALAVLAVAHLGSRFGSSLSGPLLPFAAVFFMAYRPLRDLGDASNWITRGEVALAALEEALAPPSVPPARDGTEAPMSWHRPPVVELGAYGARDRGPRTDLRIEPGEVLCLVGPTGAGKTTLLRALLGLDPEVGSLTVAGTSLIGAAAGPAYRPFAWVPQEAPLVTGTVVDNAALMGASVEAARETLVRVGAGALLEALGDTAIGPGGRELSGGERRLVALARALSSGLPILLLDEPTEGLDPDATRTVLDVIADLSPSRSVLIVTHRDEVTRIAARVVRLGTSTIHQAAAE
jgi:ABC-type transport system involved in cytochrome bd biosynthesis fused ATPase/permease subunit